VTFGFDSVWIASGGRLTRVDPSTNAFTQIQLASSGGPYRAVAIGEGAVWVPDCGNKVIYKVDPGTNRVVQEISVDMFSEVGSIGVGEGSLWVITPEEGERTLTRFNSSTGEEEAKIPLPSSSSGVLVDFGTVWVTGTGKGELYEVDPATNRVTLIVPLGREPRALASGDGSIWVLNEGDGTMQRIDPQTARVVATITGIPAGNGDIATGGGFVWLTIRGSLGQIDPRSNNLAKGFDVYGYGHHFHLCYGAESVWISGPQLLRIRLLLN
jgi:streptogramin lyase